jgi:hypothetical protein
LDCRRAEKKYQPPIAFRRDCVQHSV